MVVEGSISTAGGGGGGNDEDVVVLVFISVVIDDGVVDDDGDDGDGLVVLVAGLFWKRNWKTMMVEYVMEECGQVSFGGDLMFGWWIWWMVDLDGDCVLDCVIDGNRCSDSNNTGCGLIRMGYIYVYMYILYVCICIV